MEENKQDNIEETTKVETEQEKEMREAVEKQLEKVRTQSLIQGARMVGSVIINKCNKHLKKDGKTSLRDYERCFKDISEFITGLLRQTQQNDGEKQDDGTTEG